MGFGVGVTNCAFVVWGFVANFYFAVWGLPMGFGVLVTNKNIEVLLRVKIHAKHKYRKGKIQ